MSEKSILRQQAGLVRGAKTSCRNTADLAGACSGGKFVVSRAGGAYDAQDRGPNRKFWIRWQFHSRIPRKWRCQWIAIGRLPVSSASASCL